MKYILLFFSFISSAAFAQKSFQGNGTITLPNGDIGYIQVEFQANDAGEVRGNYRYKKYNIPVKLKGQLNNTSIVLKADELNEVFTAEVEVKNNEIFSLHGFWAERKT